MINDEDEQKLKNEIKNLKTQLGEMQFVSKNLCKSIKQTLPYITPKGKRIIGQAYSDFILQMKKCRIDLTN